MRRGFEPSTFRSGQGPLGFLPPLISEAVVAEWLRRWTRNPLGSARAGSNPADCALLFLYANCYCRFISRDIHYAQFFCDRWHCCRGRVVKAMDSKSIGIFPRRFESCQQRTIFSRTLQLASHIISDRRMILLLL